MIWRRRDDSLTEMIDGQVLPELTVAGYRFPDARDEMHYAHIPGLIDRRFGSRHEHR